MPKTETGRQALVKTLRSIMSNPEATIDQKLEACKILASINIRAKKLKEKRSQPVNPVKDKPKSGLLG